jgi:voltage-gated potassium channel
MFSPLRDLARQPEGKALVISALSTVAVGTVVYSVLEGWSLLDSLYFCVVTLATVGFGDLHPTTDAAKLFTVGYIVIGVGIIAGFLSELGKQRYTKIEGRLEAGDAPADARTTTEGPQA